MGGVRFPRPPALTATASTEVVAEWSARITPLQPGRQLIRFRWTFTDGRKNDATAQGRGGLQIATPDSLRFDFAAALGMGGGAAFVIGDSAQWAEPRERVEGLVPNYPLLWAMVGVVRPPAPGTVIRSAEVGGVLAWEYLAGGDTVQYQVREHGPRQLALQVRRGGTVVGQVVTTFDPSGRLVRSVMMIPGEQVKLELTFTTVTVPAEFDPDVWRLPSDSL